MFTSTMPSSTETDPIYEAIADLRRKEKQSNKLYGALDLALADARERHGSMPPFPLIAWRRYSAIGGSEIDRARGEFLMIPGVDKKQIEDEYLDAKARELALKHAAKEWDQRAGIARQREENERGRQGLWRARMRLAKTMPLTVAGAATFLAYVRADMAIGEEEWHGVAIGTIVRSLKALGTQAVA